MKNRKVKVLRVHTAGRLSVLAIDSDPKKHNADMDFYPWGVVVNTFKHAQVDVVYYPSNIVEVELLPETEEEEKRGPGRPPKTA